MTTPLQGAAAPPLFGPLLTESRDDPPEVSKGRHDALDRRLRALAGALAAPSFTSADHQRLAEQARAILNDHPHLVHGEWNNCRVLSEVGISLPWVRFGDNRYPPWKAMHAAFFEVCLYVFVKHTTEQANITARLINEYLELRGQGPSPGEAVLCAAANGQPTKMPLSEYQCEALIALYQLGAFGVDSRRTSTQIAERIGGGTDADKTKCYLRPLKRHQLVATVTGQAAGRAAGYYLTPEGRQRAEVLNGPKRPLP